MDLQEQILWRLEVDIRCQTLAIAAAKLMTYSTNYNLYTPCTVCH